MSTEFAPMQVNDTHIPWPTHRSQYQRPSQPGLTGICEMTIARGGLPYRRVRRPPRAPSRGGAQNNAPEKKKKNTIIYFFPPGAYFCAPSISPTNILTLKKINLTLG